MYNRLQGGSYTQCISLFTIQLERNIIVHYSSRGIRGYSRTWCNKKIVLHENITFFARKFFNSKFGNYSKIPVIPSCKTEIWSKKTLLNIEVANRIITQNYICNEMIKNENMNENIRKMDTKTMLYYIPIRQCVTIIRWYWPNSGNERIVLKILIITVEHLCPYAL